MPETAACLHGFHGLRALASIRNHQAKHMPDQITDVELSASNSAPHTLNFPLGSAQSGSSQSVAGTSTDFHYALRHFANVLAKSRGELMELEG
jgi:hypothetical protein